jgi:heme-degrading monooxygenase HmoA
MPNESSASQSTAVFRIDRFVVPADAVPAFLERLHHIQRTLGTLPGCQQNLVLAQKGGKGESTMVTVVEWASAQSMAAAKAAVEKRYASEGFEPSAFMQKLGVRADLGVYTLA